MCTARRWIGLLVACLALSSPVFAQTLTTTTLSADATSTDSTVTVSSATGISSGYVLFVDREAMVVASVSGTTVTVNRGSGGLIGPHSIGTSVYAGPSASFSVTDPSSGSCAPIGSAVPYINRVTARMYVCNNLGSWVDVTGTTAAAGAFFTGSGATTPRSATSVLTPTGVVKLPDGTAAAPILTFASATDLGLFKPATNNVGIALVGTEYFRFASDYLKMRGGLSFGATVTSGDLFLERDAANTLALKNGTTAQLFNLYTPGLAAVSSDVGVKILNNTAATVGVPAQVSGRTSWCGAAYNSVSTLSETDCMFAEVLPATVAGTTTQTWKLGSIINGGAATYPITVTSSGRIGASQLLLNSWMAGTRVYGDAGAANGAFWSPANGQFDFTNNVEAIGAMVKVDALPTVSACGAGSPAVVAGSTPLSGAVTIGTTSVATCTITFNGTAFPSAPHCSGAVETTTAANARAMGYSASTTVLTIVPASAWVDSSVVNWTCISSK